MKLSFPSPSKNRQLAKSLLYYLEREFKPCTFELNESLVFTVTKENGYSLAEITQAAVTFVGKAGPLASRIKDEVIATSDWGSPSASAADLFSGVQPTDIEGVFFLNEREAQALELIDGLVTKFADHFSAREISAPCLISKENLHKAGYLDRERHQIAHVQHHDSQVGCLSPVACLTSYPMLGKKQLEGSRHTFTLRTPVFRMEGNVFPVDSPLERMREYQVREIIFVGDRHFMQEIKTKYFEGMAKLLTALKVPFELSLATDIFFHSESLGLALHQLMNRTKYELNFTGIPGRELAISSLNFHDRHFVEAFGIRVDDNTRLETACIGFGLQRWLRALLLTYGDIETVIDSLNKELKYV